MKRHRHSTTITCRYFIMIVTGFQQNIALKQRRCLTVAQPAAKRSIRADLPFARQSKKKCGIFYEPGMRNGNKPTDGFLWYLRRAVFDTSHQKRPCALREGERGGTTRAGHAPDAFEVTLPRLFAFGFGCGGFVPSEAFVLKHRVELSGKFPANGLLQRERI